MLLFSLGNIPMLAFAGGFVSGSSAVSNPVGGGIDEPNRIATNLFQWVDNISHTTARRSVKFGADVRYVQLNRLYDLAFNGQITFSGLDNVAGTDSGGNPVNIPNPLIDFAQGIPDGALQFVGDSHRNFRSTSYDFFAQDSFKLRSNLTLNYGLRYELNTVLHEAHGRIMAFRRAIRRISIPPTRRSKATSLRSKPQVSCSRTASAESTTAITIISLRAWGSLGTCSAMERPCCVPGMVFLSKPSLETSRAT